MKVTQRRPMIVDCLQYSNWSEKIFRQMNAGGVSAVHVTICYHENFQETVRNITRWNRRFLEFPELIFHGKRAADVELAHNQGRTAIFFGLQNCSPVEDDIGLVEILHALGIRFMQLTYNNQSLLATGCYETEDSGITRMGRQVIREMNRLGIVIDMSHSAEKSTLRAIELSERPIAITHANPSSWHPARRNKSDDVLKALSESGGMLGFSFYPHHLRGGEYCSIRSFCEMVARTADSIGVERIGIGSDLCQDQPDSVVEWMRNGRWTLDRDFGEGSAANSGFPKPLGWFTDNRDFGNLFEGLRQVGFNSGNVEDVMGRNWLRFFEASFAAAATGAGQSRSG